MVACARSYSERSRHGDHVRAAVRRPDLLSLPALAALLLLLALAAGGCAPDDGTKLKTLEIGMTYDQAKKVIGRDGTLMPSGPGGGDASKAKRQVYVWPGKQPGTQISLIFEDGKLKEKYGVGLDQ